MADSIRETPVPHVPVDPARLRRSFHPLQLFTDHAWAARIWFVVALIAIAAAFAQPFLILSTIRTRERVVILDGSGTYHLSPLLAFEEAEKLHENQALLACLALLQKGPAGFDHPELLEKMFLPDALQAARTEAQKAAEEFAQKALHQKAEVAKITVLETRESVVLVQAEGQLIRTGVFQGQVFTEAPSFTVRFTFARNPNLATNGRYPLAVWKYEISR